MADRLPTALPHRRRTPTSTQGGLFNQPETRPVAVRPPGSLPHARGVLVLSGDTWCGTATSTRSNPLKTLRS